MTWEITVRKVQNGFIVEHDGEGEIECRVETVFKEDDKDSYEEVSPGTTLAELKVMEDLLWFIKDHFGAYNSKHNKKNLVIEIRENKEE